MLKELLYTGIGATNLIKEKVEDELKKLEEKGKINSKDVKSFVESLEERGRNEEQNFKEKIKQSIKESIEELGLVTKDDLKKLKNELKK